MKCPRCGKQMERVERLKEYYCLHGCGKTVTEANIEEALATKERMEDYWKNKNAGSAEGLG